MKLSYLLLSLIIVIGFSIGFYAQASCWIDPNGGSAGGGPCTYSLRYIPMIDLPGVTTGSGVAGTTSFASYVSALYSVAIVVAALLAVIRLVLAGAKYMMTDLVPNKGEAINDIKGSLLGLLIIIAAFVILNTINPNLTKIQIVSQIPNTAVSGDGLSGFTNVNLGSVDCTDQGLQYYACGRGRRGCGTQDQIDTICGVSPNTVTTGSQPTLINCEDKDPEGIYACLDAGNICIAQGGRVTNYNRIIGEVTCDYTVISTNPLPDDSTSGGIIAP